MSFLGALVALIALCVIPLGLRLTGQERDDYAREAADTAHSVAVGAEERLDDHHGKEDDWRLSGRTGDRITVVDKSDRVVAHRGAAITGSTARAILAGRSSLTDEVAATALVGDDGKTDGRVLLLRGTQPLEDRIHSLWLLLTAAALIALTLGAVAAALLARWIARPLHRLQRATTSVGHEQSLAPLGNVGGPPETQELSRAFDDMAARIQQLLEQQRAMTSEVSHQLRTPLAALRLRLDLLAEDVAPSLRDEIDGAQAEIARLTRLTDGLLMLARAEAADDVPEAVDVAAVVRARIELWRPLAAERGITLTCRSAATVARLGPGHLEQILDNLLANGLECLRPGQRLEVRSSWDEGEVLLTVIDNGEGMPETRREQAFLPFAGDRRGGTGLGLAIVARLVATDGGSASLHETPDGGLTVALRLPGGGFVAADLAASPSANELARPAR